MSAIVFRIVCAWCQTVVRPGDPGAPTSHAICRTCAAKIDEDEAA
jgi:hypothetical protein